MKKKPRISLKVEYLKKMREQQRQGSQPDESQGDHLDLEKTLERLKESDIAFLYYMNFGFSDITELDSMIIRSDILVERSMRNLAEAIAVRPLPDHMSAGSLRSFVTLMTNDGAEFLEAAKWLSKARNKVAHELHEDYTIELEGFYRSIGTNWTADCLNFHAAVVVLLCMIANETTDWIERKGKLFRSDDEIT